MNFIKSLGINFGDTLYIVDTDEENHMFDVQKKVVHSVEIFENKVIVKADPTLTDLHTCNICELDDIDSDRMWLGSYRIFSSERVANSFSKRLKEEYESFQSERDY